MTRLTPWIVLSVFVIYLAVAIFPPGRSAEGFDLAEFGRLPLLTNRLVAIDTVARAGLLQIRGTMTVPLENTSLVTRVVRVFKPAPPALTPRTAGSLDATEWLLELLTSPGAADSRAIFRVDDRTLIRTLGLDAPASSGPAYYTFTNLGSRRAEIGKQTARISQVKPADRAAWERECLALRNALIVYERLKNSLQPNSLLQREAGGKQVDYEAAALMGRYQSDLRAAAAAAKEHGKLDPATEDRIRTFTQRYARMSSAGLLALIPPAAKSRDGWRDMGAVMVESTRTGQLPPPVMYFAAMGSAFTMSKPAAFDAEIAKYRKWLAAQGLGRAVTRARYDFFYNLFEPFVRAAVVYLVAFVLICAFWLTRSAALYRSAAMILVLAWVLHTAGMLFRMMLSGLPPVTDVYSSILFAGWAIVVLGGIVERFRTNGYGITLAAMAGLIALMVMNGLAPGGVAELVRTVQHTSFWLAVVSTIIVLGLGRDTGMGRPTAVTEPDRAAREIGQRPSAVLARS